MRLWSHSCLHSYLSNGLVLVWCHATLDHRTSLHYWPRWFNTVILQFFCSLTADSVQHPSAKDITVEIRVFFLHVIDFQGLPWMNKMDICGHRNYSSHHLYWKLFFACRQDKMSSFERSSSSSGSTQNLYRSQSMASLGMNADKMVLGEGFRNTYTLMRPQKSATMRELGLNTKALSRIPKTPRPSRAMDIFNASIKGLRY